MNMRVLFANALTIAFCLSGSLYSYAGDDSREAAWTAWKKGNVAEAATLASNVKDAAERNHSALT